MTTTIGDLDRRIVIERATKAQGGDGQDVPTWAALTTVWAKRTDASDSESFKDGQELSQRITRFVVRSSSVIRTVTAKDRVTIDDAVYDIEGVKETAEGRARFIEISTKVNNADAAS